jgi:hypothetical protein
MVPSGSDEENARMSTPRPRCRRSLPRAFVATLALAPFATALAPAPRVAVAGDLLPGEVPDLTPDARAAAQKQIDALNAGTDCPKSVRALLAMGPAIWPVLENAMRLNPPEAARPHFNYLKALLHKKADPDFEVLRDGLRRKMLTGGVGLVYGVCQEFRIGRPDPAKPGKRLPLGPKPTKNAQGANVFKCPDGTITLAFGADGVAKAEDAADSEIEDATAGVVIVIAGRAMSAPGSSGHGANVTVRAPNGFAYAWAGDGANAVKPDGTPGEAGVAEATGAAGQFAHQGKAGAP